MIERLIIAGGRHCEFTEDDIAKLDALLPVGEVVSGGASGADWCGETWAKQRRIPTKVFKAKWRQFGTKAGPMRNREMAKYATAVALFPGGRGTESMHEEAVKAGLTIIDFRDPVERERR